jgi:hypothetical protein
MPSTSEVLQDAGLAPAGADGDKPLRDQLTMLIALGLHPRYTPEDLWAAQGQDQSLKPPQAPRFDLPTGEPGDYAAMPLAASNPNLRFPQAMPSVSAPNPQPPPNMPPLPETPPVTPRAALFPGAQSVDVKPYGLPKSRKKQDSRKAKD